MQRRTLLKLGILSTASFFVRPFNSIAQLKAMNELKRQSFGTDFLFGTATAAAQIEGAWTADGKSPSIWDTFSQKKGKIADGSTTEFACDFYHKYEEDIDLMADLGFDVFRFSIAWTRILPNGTGHVNQQGIDYYNRVIDKCLSLIHI